MRRRLVLLVVVSAAAAAAVVYYVGRRSRDILRGRDEWEAFAEATAGPSSRGARAAPTLPDEEGPTEAAPMVVATMEATSQAGESLGRDGYSGNGAGAALVESEPTRAGTEAPLGSIRLEPVETGRSRRASGITLAILGALAGAGAIALGAWGIASNISGDDGSAKPQNPTALENVSQVVSLIAKPTTATIPLQGSQRRIILVVGARGYGVLVLNDVGSLPAGKTYEAWVIKPNVKAPQPAGLFTGGTGVVTLTKPVPPGAVVAITVEPAGGSRAPTQKPKLVATRT